MSDAEGRTPRWREGWAGAAGPRELAVGGGALLIACQLAFRAWALYPSWFFLDDYNLLTDAARSRLGAGYLLTPYNGHLMPVGRLLVWFVQASGPLDWRLAATEVLLLQLLAGCAALWMLVVLFGARPAVLAPLALYLSTAVTFPATMWYAAALNLLPVQVTFFAAVAAFTTYLRGGSRWWLLATVLVLVAGLLCDVKAVLVVPVLAYVALAWFGSGSPVRRVRSLVLGRPLASASLGTVLLAYLGYYLTQVPQITSTHVTVAGTARIANTMLGTSLPSGMLGGPWRWSDLAPPTAYAQPPSSAVSLAWVVGVVVVLYGRLRRTRTLRAWALAAGYLWLLLVLLVASRGTTFGAVVGLEYRYLTDGACALVLAVGLAFLPLRGAVESSEPRDEPLLRVAVPARAVAALVLAVTVSGVVSSAGYAGFWHGDNASRAYTRVLRDDLRAAGAVDVASQPVPDDVMSHLAAPHNTSRLFVDLLTDRARYPRSSDRLVVVAPDGSLHRAAIQTGVRSTPGPAPGCGWVVRERGRSIPLAGRAFSWSWWLRIGYLASRESPVTVAAGAESVRSVVHRGLNSLYVEMAGAFDRVRIGGLEPGTTVCVDTVEVGQPVPGGRLS